jgi:hypothetical protein
MPPVFGCRGDKYRGLPRNPSERSWLVRPRGRRMRYPLVFTEGRSIPSDRVRRKSSSRSVPIYRWIWLRFRREGMGGTKGVSRRRNGCRRSRCGTVVRGDISSVLPGVSTHVNWFPGRARTARTPRTGTACTAGTACSTGMTSTALTECTHAENENCQQQSVARSSQYRHSLPWILGNISGHRQYICF